MTRPTKPTRRPANPRFSSGPCTRRPGWSVDALKGALLGRNHRQPETKARIELALTKTRDLLQLPAGYRVALVPASLRHMRRTGVVYRPLAETSPLMEVGLAWREGDESALNKLIPLVGYTAVAAIKM